VAVASAGPYANLHLAPDKKPCQHPTTQIFTGRVPFLPPNQQRQITEGHMHTTLTLWKSMEQRDGQTPNWSMVVWNCCSRQITIHQFIIC